MLQCFGSGVYFCTSLAPNTGLSNKAAMIQAAPKRLRLVNQPLTPLPTAAVAAEDNPKSDDEECEDPESETNPTDAKHDTASEAEYPGSQQSSKERDMRYGPQNQVQGEDPRTHKRSARFNDVNEVGNFGLFFGNWGMRGTVASSNDQKRQRAIHDRQILKCPGQVIILCEASDEVAKMLAKAPDEASEEPQSRTDDWQASEQLDKRVTHQHFVLRGSEESAVLIAARTDVCLGMQLLDWEVHEDHDYPGQRGKNCTARTKTMVAQIDFKQNIGHLGTRIVFLGLHGHFKTMNRTWEHVLDHMWDELARRIKTYDVKFVAGDFNMSFTDVVKQMRMRGVVCDCVAWYPWVHETDCTNDQPLGFDSCGIFYVGGVVKVNLLWNMQHLDILTAVAGELNFKVDAANDKIADVAKKMVLDTYSGQNTPGQPWGCYKDAKVPKKKDAKKAADKKRNLRQRLVDLLTSSSTDAELSAIPKREGTNYVPHMRLKQKKMNRKDWMVGRNLHNGAHFPLCVFTNAACARSEEALQRRTRKKELSGHNWYVRKQDRGSIEKHAKREAIAGKGRSGKGTSQQSDEPMRVEVEPVHLTTVSTFVIPVRSRGIEEGGYDANRMDGWWTPGQGWVPMHTGLHLTYSDYGGTAGPWFNDATGQDAIWNSQNGYS